MSIDVEEGAYYVMLWFVPGRQRDWMACLYRLKDGPYELKYRFRFYANTGNDDDDEKSWYNARPEGPTSEEQVPDLVKTVDRMVAALIKQGFAEPANAFWRVPIDGGPQKLMEALDGLPFAQKRPRH